jgi:hypothetical protein
LTTGGKAVLVHARCAVVELEAAKFAGKQNGTESVGEVRLRMWMPLLDERLHELLSGWQQNYANVLQRVFEINERDLEIALNEHRPSYKAGTRGIRRQLAGQHRCV